MAEVDLSIGGRTFRIVCADGEENSLHKAAALLDSEAELVTQQLGPLPEVRLLLMAGLMLADRTVAMKAHEAELEKRVADLTSKLSSTTDEPKFGIKTVKVPVVSAELKETLDKIASKAEMLANMADQNLAPASKKEEAAPAESQ